MWQTGDQVWAPAFLGSGYCFPVHIGSVESADDSSFLVRFVNPNSDGHVGKRFPQGADGFWRTEREAVAWCRATRAVAEQRSTEDKDVLL